MSVWKSDEKLLVFSLLISPPKVILFQTYFNIEHLTQCFITRCNTSKFVKNTPLRVLFSTLFSVFHLVMKNCVSCLIHIYVYIRTYTYMYICMYMYTSCIYTLVFKKVDISEIYINIYTFCFFFCFAQRNKRYIYF